MKLNLHPKEFLAIYSMLEGQRHAGFEESSLQEVYNRMRACIISALSSKGFSGSDDATLDAWEKLQKKKIDELNNKNEKIKSTISDGSFLTLDEADLTDEEVHPHKKVQKSEKIKHKK